MSLLQQEKYRKNAAAFALKWAKERDEKGEAHSFWDDFFRIFELDRKLFALHENRVARVGKGKGFIDLLWPGKLLVEHKSAHKNSEKDWADTLQQALDYIENLEKRLRPQIVVLCNFSHFRIFDLSKKDVSSHFIEVETVALAQKIDLFEFIPRYAQLRSEEEEHVNLQAIGFMVSIHEALKTNGYGGRDLELLLVRILFCFFAEDTGIFKEKLFTRFIKEGTQSSNIGAALIRLFEVLNTETWDRGDRAKGLLAEFPFVNGGLFSESLSHEPPSLDGIRNSILNSADMFDWSQISPEVFGSLFQAVLSNVERRSLGAHFTSEKNIRRLIEPLFLNDLWAEFAASRKEPKKLAAFRRKIGQLNFLDPACGCGNFLVVAYRELRMLDIACLRAERETMAGQLVFDVRMLKNVSIEQFSGIEIKPVSALIAQTALWLTEHQCNRLVEASFGQAIASIPLKKSNQILTANALAVDWAGLLPTGAGFDFVIGNPPFLGTSYQSNEQKEDLARIFEGIKSAGMLDFVTCWYMKAARLIKGSKTRVGFVSTNSITQGEQTGILWKPLFEDFGVKILFAHQTFKWQNEAPGVAAVHCVIIGFAQKPDQKERLIFEYDDIKGEPREVKVKNINPYLVEGADVVLDSISKPLSQVPSMQSGSALRDGGFLVLSDEEKADLLKKEPFLAPFIRKFVSGDDFINEKSRWCFWFKSANLDELKKSPELKKRFDAIQKFRTESTRAGTKKMAAFPHLIAEERQPTEDFLIIPKVSSENRDYIPIGFMAKEVIITDKTFIVPKASLFLFGILSSEMHMAWMRRVCGRLESRYSYSNTIVYNNFPYPDAAEKDQKAEVEKAAQAILDIRKKHAPKSLAQLYDPLKMPADLLAAHQKLDRAVDAAYGLTKKFASEARRVAWLFERYEGMVGKK